MQPMDHTFDAAEETHPEPSATTTTLYGLIDAISEEVQPGEDGLVAEVVFHLLETGQIKLPGFAFKVKDS